ncbi:phage terminase large subunit family protein [Pedobacter zeae]|uniref:Terminase large subunit gp17-like C-terminal domain-containing protein n=1 Tax=Pedobacter zeae TaxID=1737356 RepID=A0A7W6P462_9SPHI|nr:hypothetical protein [Pedobacter zeae]MBB4106627.1 hypothetical protein [Pedobacter zeae]GGH02796.1 hypothetical protein GCM10007422_17470 [Pedobacter zeae]
MATAKQRISLELFEELAREIRQATPTDPNETPAEQRRRKQELEKPGNEKKWMKYYCPNFCGAEFAKFQAKAIARIIKNKRWFEILMWSRELAKSTITMMTVLYLVLVKKELRNILMVSNSEDNAVRLLAPYKAILESNQRLIKDYGKQMKPGSWTDSEFITRGGVSFRGIGAGQSPRGTRIENFRVDCILIDDIDTDEECRNPKRVISKFKWIQEALIPTVSVSGNYRILMCGNKIAKICTVELASKLAHSVDQVNIRDENGKSSWPEKNSEEDIDAILGILSYSSAQKEYFNNPITEGTVFSEMHYGAMRPLSDYKYLVCYTDPSFKDSKKNDFKATVLVGKYKDQFHVLKAFVEQTTTATMVGWHYTMTDYVGGRTPIYHYMEANFLQDTLLQKFHDVGQERDQVIPIKGDKRKKPDKFTRIETLLEPLNSQGKLILNEKEISSKHMERLAEMFMALEPGSTTHDDAPDAVEGAVWIINNKTIINGSVMSTGGNRSNSKRV